MIGEILNLSIGLGIVIVNIPSYLPQQIKIISTKSTRGVSFLSLITNSYVSFFIAMASLVLNWDILVDSFLIFYGQTPKNEIFDILNSWTVVLNWFPAWICTFATQSIYFLYYLNEHDPRKPGDYLDDIVGDVGSRDMEKEPLLKKDVSMDEIEGVKRIDKKVVEKGSKGSGSDVKVKRIVKKEVVKSEKGNININSEEKIDVVVEEDNEKVKEKSKEETKRVKKDSLFNFIWTILQYFIYLFIIVGTIFFFFLSCPLMGFGFSPEVFKFFGRVCGYVSSVFTFICWAPQALVTCINKRAGSLSVLQTIIFTVGIALNLIFLIFSNQDIAVLSGPAVSTFGMSIILTELFLFYFIEKCTTRTFSFKHFLCNFLLR